MMWSEAEAGTQVSTVCRPIVGSLLTLRPRFHESMPVALSLSSRSLDGGGEGGLRRVVISVLLSGKTSGWETGLLTPGGKGMTTPHPYGRQHTAEEQKAQRHRHARYLCA